jgi:Hsp20/alpha crystallin family
LTIRAERTPHYGDSEQVIVAERPQGSFTRQLSLGEGVDPENLTAGYADGVLHLTIPVSPKTRARRVEITHAPGGSRTLSGAHPSRVGRPPAAPASAEHPPGQGGAGHHAIRAGTGPGPAENHELAATRWRPGGPAAAGRPRQA